MGQADVELVSQSVSSVELSGVDSGRRFYCAPFPYPSTQFLSMSLLFSAFVLRHNKCRMSHAYGINCLYDLSVSDTFAICTFVSEMQLCEITRTRRKRLEGGGHGQKRNKCEVIKRRVEQE